MLREAAFPNSARSATVGARQRRPGVRGGRGDGARDGNKSDVIHRQRGRMLNYARILARSGGHSDHESIIPLLTAREDGATVRRWLEDRAFRTQLDKLCDLARGLRAN